MRSYIDIINDVKDGIPCTYEEIRLALLYCSDQHFFTKRRLQRYLRARKINPLVQKIDLESELSVFYTDKQPIKKWWKDNPPKEVELNDK